MSTSPAVDPELLADFLDEAGDWVTRIGEDLMALDGDTVDTDRINRLFRGFHTIKGGAGFLGLEAMAHLCHAAEDLINLLRTPDARASAAQCDALLAGLTVLEGMMSAARAGQPLAEASDICAKLKAAQGGPDPNAEISEDEFDALLDALHGPSGAPGASAPSAKAEPMPTPVTTPAATPTAVPATLDMRAGYERRSKPRPAAVTEHETSLRVDTHRLDRILGLAGELVLARNRLKSLHDEPASVRAPAVAELDRVVSTLQSAVMQVRMQPVGRLFARMPRLVRELSRSLGKKVRLELAGEDTELDKTLVEALSDPLLHLVRNALDHGIEMPAQRRQSGKAEEGRLQLSAMQEGEHVVIELSDDGAGVDPARVRTKAIDKGLITVEQAAGLSAAESQALLFMPGFSTRDAVTEVSGRGVGLDVVKSALVALGGVVELTSEPGNGAVFRLRLPLTLSILPALMAGVDNRALAIPLSSVGEVFRLNPDEVQRIEGHPNLIRGDNRMPLVDLRQRFALPAAETSSSLVVTVHRGDRLGALVVDNVSGREEIVVKPLGATLAGQVPFTGAAVLGDGRIALVVDPDALLWPAAA